jgi:maternal effect protein oskar
MVLHENVLQSGYCVSGQTIDKAADHIKRMRPNQIILLNIGAVDIMNGKALIELVISMMRLLKICRSNGITPVLSTLPPIANHRINSRDFVTNEFNKFLMKNPFDYQVIDLQKAFIKIDGLMDANCYEEVPRYVSGYKKPLVLWNKMGRQRALTFLKQEIGSAILKLLIK